MWSAPARIGAAVVVAAVLTSCGGGGGGGTGEPEGRAAAEVCGGFAGDAATAAALQAVLGGERFEDDTSRAERALGRLRDDAAAPWADSYRPQPVKYCGLAPAEGGPKDLRIEVGAVGKGPYLGPSLAPSVTSYASGIEAFSSSGVGHVYFSCRLKAPAHEIVVETTVRGPAGVPDTDLEQRTRLITVANAAARDVAAALGCADTGLADGVPGKART
ncbi:hypothetical protein [Streptomyces sp. NPDC056361]|uniref:hypothetical protein n=1 Tax=Streptomyces sp. NPDC056361 TaxID=3345795 RepID=UPI0035D54F2B